MLQRILGSRGVLRCVLDRSDLGYNYNFGSAARDNEPPTFYQLGDNKYCKKILHIVINRGLFVSSFQISYIYALITYTNKQINKVENVINIKSVQNTHTLSSDRQYQTPNIQYLLFEHLNLCEKLQDIPFLYLLSVETAVLALRS